MSLKKTLQKNKYKYKISNIKDLESGDHVRFNNIWYYLYKDTDNGLSEGYNQDTGDDVIFKDYDIVGVKI